MVDLKRGSTDRTAIKTLQEQLRILAENGELNFKIKNSELGFFGPKTEKAIHDFRKAMHLQTLDTGEVDIALSNVIKQEVAKSPRPLFHESVLTADMSAVGKTFRYYDGTKIAKGTLKYPSPLESALMQCEGFNDKPKKDGFTKFEDFAYGVPAYNFDRYPHDKNGAISKETAFIALQDQLGFKIGQIKNSDMGKGFGQMNEREQSAFMNFAYNIDISKYQNKKLGRDLANGDMGEIAQKILSYSGAGNNKNVLSPRRNFEAAWYERADGYAELATWKKFEKGSQEANVVGKNVNYFKNLERNEGHETNRSARGVSALDHSLIQQQNNSHHTPSRTT